MSGTQRSAGIELGGTKVVCGIGNSDGEVSLRTVIPTREPTETLADIRACHEPGLTDAAGLRDAARQQEIQVGFVYLFGNHSHFPLGLELLL